MIYLHRDIFIDFIDFTAARLADFIGCNLYFRTTYSQKIFVCIDNMFYFSGLQFRSKVRTLQYRFCSSAK